MIRIEAIAKAFGAGDRRVVAVKEVSFEAPDGQVTALLGPNGAGKTTTLRMISTLVRPDAGRLEVGGIDVGTAPHQARATVGLMSDARGLSVRLSARENIRYFGRLRGMAEPALESRIEALGQQLEFSHLLDRRTEGFSTGEKLKVALARTLVHDPQHVVLDEPTNGLDVLSTRSLRRLLLNLKAQGKCVVLSSHLMQEIEALCDRLVVVAKGQSCFCGSIEDLKAQTGHAVLEDAFVALAFG